MAIAGIRAAARWLRRRTTGRGAADAGCVPRRRRGLGGRSRPRRRGRARDARALLREAAVPAASTPCDGALRELHVLLQTHDRLLLTLRAA